jgi:hypothetical protein
VRLTDFHAKYLACELTRRYASDSLTTIAPAGRREPELVVSLDEGFAGNDRLKTSGSQIFCSKGVVTFRTV